MPPFSPSPSLSGATSLSISYDAANYGTVFEQGKATIYGPIRVILAIFSLASTANGWSISQLLMLRAASIMGVGTANLATHAATDARASGQTMVVQPVMPSTGAQPVSSQSLHVCSESGPGRRSIRGRMGIAKRLCAAVGPRQE